MARTSDSLRRFCRHLVTCHPELKRCSEVGRIHVESYKLALAAHVTAKGTPLKVNTLRMRLGMLMTFFDRIIEWGYEDAPVRNPLFISDIPRPEELLAQGPRRRRGGDGSCGRWPPSQSRSAGSCSRSCAARVSGWESCARSRRTPWPVAVGGGG